MFTLERRLGHVLLAATLVASTPVLAEQQDQQGAAKTLELGRAPTGDEIRAWDIDVAPDGAGLPDGAGTLASKSAKRTIGSYWPYATTVFDYVRRAMPLDKPGSLSAEEVYALSAWLLHANGIVGADAVMNAKTLPAVRMPNRDGFIAADTKPDFIAERCMRDCK